MRRKTSKTFLETYGYFQKSIEKLATYDLDASPSIKELEFSSGAAQRAYKEIQAIDFKGTLQDYLGYLSTRFLLSKMKPKLHLLSKTEDNSGSREFVFICAEDPVNASNTVRFGMRQYALFFEAAGAEKLPSWLADTLFTTLSDIHRHIILTQKGKQPLKYFEILQKNAAEHPDRPRDK